FVFNAMTSCGVRSARPLSCTGRSSGVITSFDQTPWMSGCPSGVRGWVQVDPERDCFCWPATGTAETATATVAATTRTARVLRKLIVALLFMQSRAENNTSLVQETAVAPKPTFRKNEPDPYPRRFRSYITR